jgi:hypothetical protein
MGNVCGGALPAGIIMVSCCGRFVGIVSIVSVDAVFIDFVDINPSFDIGCRTGCGICAVSFRDNVFSFGSIRTLGSKCFVLFVSYARVLSEVFAMLET